MIRTSSGIVLFLAALLFPLLSFAQTDDLSATIRAKLLSDPRTATLTNVQVDAMVAALSAAAQKQGMTSQDILWQPQDPKTFEKSAAENRCSIMPSFFCTLSSAFGFDGSDLAIPIGLFICSALLIFLIGMLLHHRGHHPITGVLQ